jgi:hydrogenase maturation protease
MSGPARILVAGIGNIFMGDDAFGVEVARELAKSRLPEGVQVVDFGIRGFDLAYALLEDYDMAILVDAIQRGHRPGTLYLIHPDIDNLGELEEQMIETHGMHPAKVLNLVRAMDCRPRGLRLVACEPATFGPEGEGQMGLSEPVQLAVGAAAHMVERLVEEALAEQYA